MSNDQIIATLLARAATRDTDTDTDSDEEPVGPVHNEKVAQARRWAQADRARRSAGPAGTHSQAGTDDESDSDAHGQAGADDQSDSGTQAGAGAGGQATTDGQTGTDGSGSPNGTDGSGSADGTNGTDDGADGTDHSAGTGDRTGPHGHHRDEGADNQTGHHRAHTADHESGTGSHGGSSSDGRTDGSRHSHDQDDAAGSDVGTTTDDGDTAHGQASTTVHDSADDSDHPADEPEPDPEPDDPGPDDPGPDDHGPTPPPGPDPGPDQPDTPSDSSSGGGGGAAPSPPVEAPPERARTGIEIRIRLSTLLGHDQHPAEIPGLGPLLAGPARDTVARHHYAEWRFAITDPDGHLLLAGHTRHRPTTGTTPTPQPEPRPGPRSKRRRRPRPTSRPGAGQSHGGVVELQIPATLLAALVLDPPPGWERLIADLAAQYARRHRLRAALNRHPHARFPHRALRRHIEVRDRTCSFPGCRRPARKAQQDHTHEHRHGGVTIEANLGPLCIFHHAIKTAGHWQLTQPRPGTFRWTSPLHHRYLTRGEPVCPPLPDPVPPEDSAPAPDTGYGPRSAAQDALDEKPLFPEPEPQPEPDATGDGATEDTGDTAGAGDAALEHDPPDDPDNDEPPF